MRACNDSDARGGPGRRTCRTTLPRRGWKAAARVFCSSGSEGVEAAIKFARAHTRRAGILSAEHAFHGLTCGALSLMSDSFLEGRFRASAAGDEDGSFWRSRISGTRTQEQEVCGVHRRTDPVGGGRLRSRSEIICGARNHFAGGMERCLCWTKYRLACTALGLSGGASLRRRAGHGDSGQGHERRTCAVGAVLMSEDDLRFGVFVRCRRLLYIRPLSAKTAWRCARGLPRWKFWSGNNLGRVRSQAGDYLRARLTEALAADSRW